MDEMQSARRCSWTSKSEELLLKLWVQNLVQLNRLKKKREIFIAISKELRRHGFAVNSEMVRSKMHNMRNRYKRERSLVASSGGVPSTWDCYTQMHRILGGFEKCSLKITSVNSVGSTPHTSLPSPPVSVVNSDAAVLSSQQSTMKTELPTNSDDSMSSNQYPCRSQTASPTNERKLMTPEDPSTAAGSKRTKKSGNDLESKSALERIADDIRDIKNILRETETQKVNILRDYVEAAKKFMERMSES